jgi:hypothetical protein
MGKHGRGSNRLLSLGEMPFNPKPLAESALDRGDFGTKEWRIMMSGAIYGWWNKDHNNKSNNTRGRERPKQSPYECRRPQHLRLQGQRRHSGIWILG